MLKINSNPKRNCRTAGNTLVPIIVSVVAPALITFLLIQFIFIPKMEKMSSGEGHGDHAAHGDAHGGHGDGHDDSHGGGHMYHKSVDGVVTNLAGVHRTRFIKVSYEIGGSDKKFEAAIDHSKAKIRAATMEYLSGLTMAQIHDNPRMMNLAGKELLKKLNQVHGVNGVIEELSFTEFSIQ